MPSDFDTQSGTVFQCTSSLATQQKGELFINEPEEHEYGPPHLASEVLVA